MLIHELVIRRDLLELLEGLVVGAGRLTHKDVLSDGEDVTAVGVGGLFEGVGVAWPEKLNPAPGMLGLPTSAFGSRAWDDNATIVEHRNILHEHGVRVIHQSGQTNQLDIIPLLDELLENANIGVVLLYNLVVVNRISRYVRQFTLLDCRRDLACDNS
ncbi:unnamed protein product [Phytomonas sp. Hart1]|nr:unnamed protein product [Phytomonas sp. Hart1]|eukprot:CCW65925.1 unnamed protein product [Phytomonas sp. isolate Hart1]